MYRQLYLKNKSAYATFKQYMIGGNEHLWQQRPIDLQNAINEHYKVMSAGISTSWHWNGQYDNSYNIMYIDDMKLIYKLAKNKMINGIKNFYILELGSGGEMGWIMSVSTFLFNSDLHNMTFHIFATNIELNNNLSDGLETMNNPNKSLHIIIHKLQTISAENIISDSRIIGENKDQLYDFVITRRCLTHLFDPIGTIIQIIAILNNDGIFLFDSFVAEVYDKSENILYTTYSNRRNVHSNNYIWRFVAILFQIMNVNFLICDACTSHGREPSAYIVQKTKLTNIDNVIPIISYKSFMFAPTDMSYGDVNRYTSKYHTADFGKCTQFYYVNTNKILNKKPRRRENLRIIGNCKDLFELLWPRQNVRDVTKQLNDEITALDEKIKKLRSANIYVDVRVNVDEVKENEVKEDDDKISELNKQIIYKTKSIAQMNEFMIGKDIIPYYNELSEFDQEIIDELPDTFFTDLVNNQKYFEQAQFGEV